MLQNVFAVSAVLYTLKDQNGKKRIRMGITTETFSWGGKGSVLRSQIVFHSSAVVLPEKEIRDHKIEDIPPK